MSHRTYEFIQLDVFTQKPLEGNPLAVFPDARGPAAPFTSGDARIRADAYVGGTHGGARRVQPGMEGVAGIWILTESAG